MTERPILMSEPMVRAILEGRKTQTRRLVRLPCSRGVLSKDGWRRWDPERADDRESMAFGSWVYGILGDRLWVRETWAIPEGSTAAGDVAYRADLTPAQEAEERAVRRLMRGGAPWRPSIHMPRWASRLVLEVTDVRVQRLQEISEEDAEAEGVEVVPNDPFGWNHRRQFQALWDSINGKRAAWATNPYVWAITFRKAR